MGDAHRLTRRDLSWRDTTMVRVVGGLPAVDVDDVRARLAVLRGTRFVAEHNLASGEVTHPRDLDRLLDRMIQASDLALTDGVDQLGAAARDLDLAGLPMRLLVGDDWVAARYSHVLGDGSVMWRLLSALTAPGSPGDLTWFRTRGTRLPLARAVGRTFGRSPSLVARVREGRAPLPVQASASALPAIASVTCRSDVAMRELLGQRPEGARTPAYLIALAVEEARRVGLRVEPGVSMLVDLRRYLPAGAEVVGNFAAGSWLALPDPGDAVAVSSAIDGLLESGRPLLALAASTRRTRRGETQVPASLDGDGGATVISFSLNRHQQPPPGVSAAELHVALIGKPLGRHGISLNLSEIGNRLHCTATYHPEHVTKAQATAVVERLVSGSTASSRPG